METKKPDFSTGDHYASLANAELVKSAPGSALAKMTISSKHLNALDIAHGGAIFTLADYAFGAAANSYGSPAVCLQANISFIKACAAGTVYAEAREISRRRTIGTYEVCVRDEAGETVAHFTATAYFKHPKKS